MSRFSLVVFILLLSGCAVIVVNQYDQRYGPAEVGNRQQVTAVHESNIYREQVQPLLNQRCVVCHGCYDAPCQLKLTSPEGIERGLTKSVIHSGSRLLAIEPTRLYEDATTTQGWRDKEFSPVLNERIQSPEANLEASLLFRSLALKQRSPLPNATILSDEFDLSLNRDQHCGTIEEYDEYEKANPLAGMPYGLPGVNGSEFEVLQNWLRGGALMSPLPDLDAEYIDKIARWERWLNQVTNKSQLVSRYVYEHLFLSHLYFSDLPSVYFKLIRSKTPPGMPIEIIATRRPYDDPKVDRVYYRFMREQETILAKTHLPYALNDARMATFDELFFQPDYDVDNLPSYDADIASNPFIAFEQLPAKSRYSFMLQEAQNTIMGFIKGPVCRGQIALNVIDDHFWVFFASVDAQEHVNRDDFLEKEKENLLLPAKSDSNSGVVTNWIEYSRAQNSYLRAKHKKLNQLLDSGSKLDTHILWHGEALTATPQARAGINNAKMNRQFANDNAALTVFRHFDSATVVKGLVGQDPKTAWLIDYPLLERIHYLLVAGFDVYGNVGHQLNTRLYMDFLRMEAEFSFLNFLPSSARQAERDYWYRDEGIYLKAYLENNKNHYTRETNIAYKTQSYKSELFELLKSEYATVLPAQFDLQKPDVTQQEVELMQSLMSVTGKPVNQLPEVSILLVKSGKERRVYSFLKNVAHSNMSSLLNEESNLLPEEDSLTVVRGIIGDYPGAYLSVDQTDLAQFAASFKRIKTPQDYKNWLDRFGVRRTDINFWTHSDEIQEINRQLQPVRAGLLDYNRLENR